MLRPARTCRKARRLTRCARRPFPSSLVGGVVFAGADAEHASKSFSVLVGQRILAALDALQDRRRQLSIGGQLRLGEAAHDPPIAWVALLGGECHD
jgi:hypothetical protein